MARILLNTKAISYEDWQNLRKKSLGGSDASTVMSMNRFASPLSLYAEKMGLTRDKETSVAMMVGTHCEELVARMFEEETGLEVWNDTNMYVHDEYDFITANLDRRIGDTIGLECKTTSAYTLKDFEDGKIPDNYYWQCIHYMAVMNFEKMFLACIISNRHFVWREIERDEDAIDMLIAREVAFWRNHIETGTEPEVDGSDATEETLRSLYPTDDEDEVELDIDDEVERYLYASQMVKEWESRKKTAQQEIEQKLGSHQIAQGSRFQASWKSSSRAALDTKLLKAERPDIFKEYSKTTTSRIFRAKEK